jgi:hypothetical protein
MGAGVSRRLPRGILPNEDKDKNIFVKEINSTPIPISPQIKKIISSAHTYRSSINLLYWSELSH